MLNIEVVCRGNNTVTVTGAKLDLETMKVQLELAPNTVFSDEPGGVPVPLPVFDSEFPGIPEITQDNTGDLAPVIINRIPYMLQLYYGA